VGGGGVGVPFSVLSTQMRPGARVPRSFSGYAVPYAIGNGGFFDVFLIIACGRSNREPDPEPLPTLEAPGAVKGHHKEFCICNH